MKGVGKSTPHRGDSGIGGTRVKLVKRVEEGGGKSCGEKTGQLSAKDGRCGKESGQPLSRKWDLAGTQSSIRGKSGVGEVEVHGVKAGLPRVGLFESAAAVGRVGPAYIATGKGGAAVAGVASMGASWDNHEGKLAGRGRGAKGRAGFPTSSKLSPCWDEGYYAHSYGQLAIHKEMLQV